MSIANEPARILDSSAASEVKPRATRLAARVVLLLLAAICSGFILREIVHDSVQVPFWDEWDCMSYYQKYETGEIPISALVLARKGEHLIGVSVAGSILLWRLTGTNFRLIVVWNWFLAVAFVAFMALVAKQALPPRSLLPWVILSTSAFFVFNPGAFQMWLWGIPPVYLIAPLLFLAAAFCAQLKLPLDFKILVSAVAAVIASFTLGAGVLLWALLPVVLVTCTPWRQLIRRHAAIAAYALSGLTMAVLHLHNLLTYKTMVPADQGSVNLGALTAFFLAYTGNLVLGFPATMLITWAQGIAIVLLIFLGLSVVAAVRTCRGKPEWTALTIWLCLAVYQLIAGGLVALTRHTLGANYPLEASRYVLSTSFLPAVTMAIAMVALRAYRSRLPGSLGWYSGLLCAITAVLTICLVIRGGQIPPDLASFRQDHKQKLMGKVALAAANLVTMPEYRYIYPYYPDSVSFRNLSNFVTPIAGLPHMWDDEFVRKLASTAAVNPSDNGGFIDTFTVQADKLSLSGWAYLRTQQKTADAVIILAIPLSGQPKLLEVVFPSLPRPDVAASVGNPDASDTGWAASITSPLPEAGTVIRCFAYEADSGQIYPLSGDRSL